MEPRQDQQVEQSRRKDEQSRSKKEMRFRPQLEQLEERISLSGLGVGLNMTMTFTCHHRNGCGWV
jgi:hypothetical protein